MTGFSLTAEQRQLQERARAFAESVIRPRMVELDRTNAYPHDIVNGFGGRGLHGAHDPQRRMAAAADP